MILQYKHPGWLKKLIKSGLIFNNNYKSNLLSEDLVEFTNSMAKENILNNTGGPFGAIIFDKNINKIVGYGVNTSTTNGAIFHAEVTAIWDALYRLKIPSFKLHPHSFILASSSAPCCMCLGAAIWSGVSHIYSGATTKDVESIGFDEGPLPSNIEKECKKRNIILKQEVRRDSCCKTLKYYKQIGNKFY